MIQISERGKIDMYLRVYEYQSQKYYVLSSVDEGMQGDVA